MVDAETQGQNETATESSPLAARVAELEEQVKEKENKYLYLYADFDNSKKRVQKERTDLIKFGWEPIARDLLQVVDNLERAIQHMPIGTDKILADGLHMVVSQFRTTLEKGGVQLVHTLEQAFDPNLHEAVGSEESHHPEGTIVKEAQRGYLMHGRLLRPAQVVVSGGKKD